MHTSASAASATGSRPAAAICVSAASLSAWLTLQPTKAAWTRVIPLTPF